MGRLAHEKKKRESEMEKSNYTTVTGLSNMQKSGSDGDSGEGWGLELGKAENLMSSIVLGFVTAYSVTGLQKQKNMSLI